MTETLQDSVVVLDASALESPAAFSAPLLGPRTCGAIARVGLFAAVWLPTYAFVASSRTTVSASVFATSALALVWTLCLAGAFAAAHRCWQPLGLAPGAAVGTATGAVAVSALALWSRLRLEPGVFAVLTLAVFVCALLWQRLVGTTSLAERRVLLVGGGGGGSELAQDLAFADTQFKPVGLVTAGAEQAAVAGVPVHEGFDTLAEIVAAARPDIVVVAPSTGADAIERLLDAAGSGFRVLNIAEFHEYAFGLVPVHTLTPTWFMQLLHAYNKPYTQATKRAFDVVVASLGLLATCWLYPLVAFLVSRTPGPVFYKQTRLGEHGRLFTIYKFRSMCDQAETDGAVWAADRDPRVTRVGAFLRKTRIDELPQLWNVLRGEMSIVGPRPERPEFLGQLADAVPFWTRRHLVKPGITGWAQVTYGYTADATETGNKLARDLWYLRHRSLLLDLCICVKTFTTVVTGAGAR